MYGSSLCAMLCVVPVRNFGSHDRGPTLKGGNCPNETFFQQFAIHGLSIKFVDTSRKAEVTCATMLAI